MRPLDMSLRERYATSATALQTDPEVKINKRALAGKLGLGYQTVRTFLFRNPDLLEDLGVKHRTQKTVEDYAAAVQRVAQKGAKRTHINLARELGIDRTSVTRFLDAHPEIRVLLKTATFRKMVWHDVTVQHFDESVQRIVLNKVSRIEYARLWKAEKLEFQVKGIPKPEYLPSLEEVEGD